MISLKVLIFVIITLKNIKPIKSARPFDIRWTATNCSIIDQFYVTRFDCPIEELPRNRGNFLNINFIFKQMISRMTIDFRISMPGKQETDLIKVRTDACKLATYQSQNLVVNAITRKLLQAGNFPKTCPLQANFTYFVKKFALNPDYFPGYTPELNFTVKLNLFSGKSHLISANIAAGVIKKRKV